MRKWIIGGGILLALFAAFLIAVVNVNFYIQRNREYLLQQAAKAIGRPVSVGKIEVSIWRGLGIRFQDFKLADDPAFSSDDFVRARDLQLNLKLLPLLRRNVQIKKVILNQPVINIIRNKEGVYNFSTLGKTDKQKQDEAKKENKPGTEEARGGAAFLISLIDMTKGDVRYRELAEGTDLQIKQIDLEVEDLDLNRPFSVSLAAALFTSNQNIKFKTVIGPIAPERDYRRVPVDGVIDIDSLDVNQLKNAVPKIKAVLPKELDLSGVFKVAGLNAKGSLENLAVNGSIEGTNGSILYGKSFQKPAGIPLALTTDAQYTGDRIILRKSVLKLYTLPLQAKGEIALGGTRAVDLSLNSEPTALEGWEKLVPPMADYHLKGKMQLVANVRGPIGQGHVPQIQGKLMLQNSSIQVPQLAKPIDNLNTQVNFSGQRAEIRDASLNLGNSPIRLTAMIDKFSPLTVSYKLTSPQLAATDLQSQLSEERKNDVFRNLSSDGQITTVKGNITVAGRLVSSDGKLYNIDYKDLDANLAYGNKVASVRAVQANILNGALRLSGEYAFNDLPRFSASSEIKSIDIEKLYQYFKQNQRDVRGNLNADLKINGQGHQWQEIKPNLRGDGQAEIVQGALLNVNIADAVLSGATGVPGLTNLISPAIRKKYPETFEAKDTEFKQLQTQLNLGEARINFKNLQIAAAQFKVEGNGWADFDRRVDFRGVLRLSPELSTDIAGAVRELRVLFNNNKELEIPFTLSGVMPHVRPRPDATFLTKALQRGLLQKGADELQQQLFGSKERKPSNNAAPEEKPDQKKPSTEELIRKGLEGLFNRQREKK